MEAEMTTKHTLKLSSMLDILFKHCGFNFCTCILAKVMGHETQRFNLHLEKWVQASLTEPDQNLKKLL